MKSRMIRNTIGLLVTLSLAFSNAYSQQVLHAPTEGCSLAQRIDWAHSQVSTARHADGYWLGYSIKCYMHENSHIGNYSSRHSELPTLYGILSGRLTETTNAEAIREQEILNRAQQTLQSPDSDKTPDEKVLKEVAILFRYPSTEAGPTQFDKVRLTNMDLHVDLDGRGLIWLGPVEDAESIPYLDGLYDKLSERKNKKDIMVAIALHESDSRVLPCLKKYITREKDAELRGEAAFWLGQQDSPDALKTLKEVFKKEESEHVQKKIVFAASQMSLEEATDFLIEMARSSESNKVRKEAIFWLGQKASKKAMESLSGIVFDKETTELHEQAVFAISQWPNDHSIPALSKIGRDHPNPEVRKKAIFWLGQTGDPRAVDVLVEIVKKTK